LERVRGELAHAWVVLRRRIRFATPQTMRYMSTWRAPREGSRAYTSWSDYPDTELFEELDQEFHDYPDDLSALLHRFVMDHRSDIRGT
jgi:hypothetical protein